VICFRCGEKNPDSYRFCGMCGGPLQPAKPASGSEPARPEPTPEQNAAPPTEVRTENFPFSRAERLTKPAPTESVPPIGGPSLLGLNEPSLDSLREKAFSSAEETYFEPEAGAPAWKRIFMTLVVLGALGGAAWWAYTNYAQPGAGAPPDSGPKQDTAANPPAAAVPQKKEPAPPAVPASASTDSSTTADAKKTTEQPQVNDSTVSDTKKTDEQANGSDSAPQEQAKTEQVKPVEKPQAEAPQPNTVAPAVKPATSVVARKAIPAPEKAVKAPPAVVPAEGDALFRRGEAYLYGRGVAENCDQAIKNLKAASDKSHAKARSAFGTMYATGHCVSRDLPTSYRWFALALRVDPNNQILEKDLSAVWNQMTPPERQLATKPSSQ
jgi:hypothetical protein